ncbi:MAG TPA: hypothetical protein VLE91_04480 [Candidatus Saccharimonadales bacterium]|nr:hypothetical protein [Candidatus Saccharimonadales bacterium]
MGTSGTVETYHLTLTTESGQTQIEPILKDISNDLILPEHHAEIYGCQNYCNQILNTDAGTINLQKAVSFIEGNARITEVVMTIVPGNFSPILGIRVLERLGLKQEQVCTATQLEIIHIDPNLLLGSEY